MKHLKCNFHNTKSISFLILVAALFFSCSGLNKGRNNVVFEIPQDTISPNRYTVDNKIYQGNNTYRIKYEYFNSDSIQLQCKKDIYNKDSILNMDGNSYVYIYHKWRFAQIDSLDENSYTYIDMKVLPDFGPFEDMSSTYEQSVIQYEYKNENGKYFCKETTGLVENDKNIWIHPPRSKAFKILGMNPFPYIKSPYKIGQKWKWSLTLGSVYADKRWISWEDQIELKYLYQITGKKVISTEFYTNIECYVITACAKSKLGKSYLTSYFNEEYGFIKLDYVNIDDSKLILQIQKLENNK